MGARHFPDSSFQKYVCRGFPAVLRSSVEEKFLKEPAEKIKITDGNCVGGVLSEGSVIENQPFPVTVLPRGKTLNARFLQKKTQVSHRRTGLSGI
jgi:hypothetical protein